jgi:hypothetical protein
MWKKIRIFILLLILLVVAVDAYRDQNQDWSKPIFVLMHPINADGSAVTQQYIQQLSEADLAGVQQYLKEQAAVHTHVPINFYFRLGQPLQTLPPKVPEQAEATDAMLWSLKFRYYAWKNKQNTGIAPNVTLYLNFYDPVKNKVLKHSTALEKGRIGSVNLFAAKNQSEQNKVVLVHELLHAFGATDKYDFNTGQPLYPIGYAYPDQKPLFPQAKAELMGGYIPTSQNQSKTPDSVKDTLINELTATEIGWKPL